MDKKPIHNIGDVQKPLIIADIHCGQAIHFMEINMEIERKFLVKRHSTNMERNICCEHFRVEQTYFSINPEKRIRKITYKNVVTLILTHNGKGTLTRAEEESFICKKQFKALLSSRITTIIRKIRYKIPFMMAYMPN